MPRTRARRWAEALASVLLLTVGGLLYVLYRPKETLLLHLADELGMDGVTGRWRRAAAMLTPPEWMVYSLPAGLWATSYLLIVDSLTMEQPPKGRMMAVSFVPLLGVGSELMQAVEILPGTFDWLDLGLYILPIIIWYIVRRTRLLSMA